MDLIDKEFELEDFEVQNRHPRKIGDAHAEQAADRALAEGKWGQYMEPEDQKVEFGRDRKERELQVAKDLAHVQAQIRKQGHIHSRN